LCQYSFVNKLKSHTVVSREKLCKTLLYKKKFAHKILVKFIFALPDPKSAKKTDNFSVFFVILGSALVKSACRMLMKLTPGVNFINILRGTFTCTDSKSAKKTDGLTVFFAHLGSMCLKALNKMLVKLTPEVFLNDFQSKPFQNPTEYSYWTSNYFATSKKSETFLFRQNRNF